MARQPKGRPTIYLGNDKMHHCWLTVGSYPDGKPKRKHIKRRTAAEVADEVDAVLKRLRQGAGQLAKIETVEQWLAHWVHVILLAKRGTPSFAWSTWGDYEQICRNHIIPNIGQWRLTGRTRRLEPEHVEAMYATLGARLAPSYVVRVHRVLTIAIKLAYRRGRADRNVMDLVDAPTFRATKIRALPLGDASKVLAVALQDDLAARWGLGIIAGPRQGEVLGIRWRHVELDPQPPDVPNVTLEKQIQRRTWRHGCPDPVVCVKTRTGQHGNPIDPCRTNPCEPLYAHGCMVACGKKLARYCPQRTREGDCYRHRTKDGQPKACPPPCDPDCTKHASTCPQRKDGGLVEVDLKTHASEESLALGELVTELFRRHRERQIQAGSFDPDGFVFSGPGGGPLDPRRDYEAWCGLLRRAGVKHQRLHAARHTAGTFLRATGSDMKMVQEILRHADLSMTGRYVDVAMEARKDALDRVAAALVDGDLSKIMGAQKVA